MLRNLEILEFHECSPILTMSDCLIGSTGATVDAAKSGGTSIDLMLEGAVDNVASIHLA